MFLCKWRARKQISLHRDNKVVLYCTVLYQGKNVEWGTDFPSEHCKKNETKMIASVLNQEVDTQKVKKYNMKTAAKERKNTADLIR